MSKTSDYIAEYKDYAMEQMKRYGIPASVTLAQGILESANGKSQLSQECNNHFGIKANKSWIESGGQYRLYTDDKPNEKFCQYASVGDSYEHHSRILVNSDRYKACFKLSPDDYVGWTNGLQKGGYATNQAYAKSLQKIIESQNLQQYDKQVMEELKREGKSIGVDSHPRQTKASQPQGTPTAAESSYSFPVKRSEYMLITSPFGNRTDPMNASKQQFHKGIDIQTKHEAVLATEDNGKVIAVNQNVNTGGGKSVTVEYDRADGSKYQCVYMHLDSIKVKQGDTVQAGQDLGISGNTGTRTTGEHLHFGVKRISSDGTSRDMNPAAYLAEIAVRGNIKLEAQHNGKDLIGQFKSGVDVTPKGDNESKDSQLSPDDWIKKLLCSEDSGVNMGNDPIMEYAMTMFTSLMAIASQIDQGTTEQKNQTITNSMVSKVLDLKVFLPNIENPLLQVTDKGTMVFSYNSGGKQYATELSEIQSTRLNDILTNGNTTAEQKKQSVNAVLGGIIASQKASENYQQINSSQQTQETVQRR